MQSLCIEPLQYSVFFLEAENALFEVRLSMRLVGNALEVISKLHMNGSDSNFHVGSRTDTVLSMPECRVCACRLSSWNDPKDDDSEARYHSCGHGAATRLLLQVFSVIYPLPLPLSPGSGPATSPRPRPRRDAARGLRRWQ